MVSFAVLSTGATAQAADVDQIINALNGTVGQGIPLAVTAVNDSVNFALALKNTDPTNSRALQVLRANNLVLLQADVNGVVASPDGVAAAAPVVTTTGAQTLSGAKTFSGGLTVSAGNVGIGNTPTSNRGLFINGSISPTGAVGIGADINPTLTAAANNDQLWGLQVFPLCNLNAKTGIKAVGIEIPSQAYANAPTAVAIEVGAVTGTGTNNYGIIINAPVGASAENFGLKNQGAAQVNGASTFLSFFGHAANSQGSSGAAATDLASVITLANALQTIGKTYGLWT